MSDKKLGCLFITPTVMARPEFEISNVEHLAKEFPNDRVLFISNIEDEDFSNYQPTQPNIEKHVSNKLYSIARALNHGIDLLEDEQYICFVQSDIRFERLVIEQCKQISDHTDNAGIVGTTKHSNFHRFNRFHGTNPAGQQFFTTLWADGIMFWSKDVLDKVGLFTEEYFGDKESQEYCYRAHDLGMNNIYFTIAKDCFYESKQVPFEGKTKYNVKEFLDIKTDTVNRFREKWCPWEEKQYHRFT